MLPGCEHFYSFTISRRPAVYQLFQEDALLGVVTHICNPSIWEVEAGGLQVQSQSQQHSESEARHVKPGL